MLTENVALPVIESVLVIDDSIVQRRHSVELCRAMGVLTVHEATNGREALALLEAMVPAPSLLIIDLEMPTMDGPELLAQLRQRNIDIPILVASSKERSLLQSVRHMGGVLGLQIIGTAQKPLTLEALSAVLGTWSLEPRRQADVRKRIPIEPDALRVGIERAEIRVHYQPQIDIRTGTVRAVEALARWEHPTRGMIMPDEFIALAEQHDLIHKLTLSVLNQALLQTATWQAQDVNLPVAINLSPRLLESSGLVQEIISLQQCYAVPAERVILEVTESSLMQEVAVALGVLTRLRLRGFGLALDDYGTGFSSMQQLAQIPFTELKIDRSFVRGAHERDNLRVMLRSAIDMANELGLVTVAEGVETEEELRLLRDYGCTFAQGWLIAKPMPGGELAGWLRVFEARL